MTDEELIEVNRYRSYASRAVNGLGLDWMMMTQAERYICVKIAETISDEMEAMYGDQLDAARRDRDQTREMLYAERERLTRAEVDLAAAREGATPWYDAAMANGHRAVEADQVIDGILKIIERYQEGDYDAGSAAG